ncbi:hypothetical protein OBBRIDRAFT_356430 [Obba rivulosa]|uniref:Uncharacterized protein n=1 Tax=Obba rivulosa TaxID=1052685 RepID=A0A8E2DEJ9_9APHY|nr:hypothetical protein OBBRIDRAFT_356430 [Obba rivulosa]
MGRWVHRCYQKTLPWQDDLQCAPCLHSASTQGINNEKCVKVSNNGVGSGVQLGPRSPDAHFAREIFLALEDDGIKVYHATPADIELK